MTLMNGDQLKIKMLGVGRKPPFVLNDILLSVLPTGSLDNCNPKFGLAPGQMTRFNNSPDDLNSKPVSSHISRAVAFLRLCRDSRPYYLCSIPIQNEGGLSSATTKGTVSRPPTPNKTHKEKNPYKRLAASRKTHSRLKNIR